MAATLVDNVRVNVTSMGTGALSLGSAVDGYRGVEALQNGKTYNYKVVAGSQWEIGQGQYLTSGSQLVRTPLHSSNGDGLVDLPQNAQVSFVALASDFSGTDLSQEAIEAKDQAVLAASQAQDAAAQAMLIVEPVAAIPTDAGAGVVGTTSGEKVQDFIDGVGSQGGSARVGADDGSSGSLFTTVQGSITKLLSKDGAGLPGFSHTPSAPYISKTVGDRLSKVVYVTDAPYEVSPGPVGGGAGPDVTVPLQQAISSGASKIILPSLAGGQNYYVSDTISLPDYITIEGQNNWSTGLISTVNNIPIFHASGRANVEIGNIRLGYSTTPVDGAYAIYLEDCIRANFSRLVLNWVYDGIRILRGGVSYLGAEISALQVYEYVGAGISAIDALSVHLNGFEMSAGSSTGGYGGIHLKGGVEGFIAANGEVLLGTHGFVTESNDGTNNRGVSPWHNKINSVLFDSPAQAAGYIRNTQHLYLENSWFASSGHDKSDIGYTTMADYSGLDIAGSKHVKMRGGQLYGNGGRGALVYQDNSYIDFIGVTAARNQRGRSSNGSAIDFVASGGVSPSNFKVQGCTFERDADTTTYRQTAAVNVFSGPADYYNITNNGLGGCTVTDNGTGTNKTVSGNN
ncbi:hypothetical protein F1640_14980 [Novosphingobium sp. NBM11]|uniref:hypothetical protein n=1 Tax=Novosphingobium sp. NBM11 TaxID=2596914 RepID=UPI00189263C9|nr:hypothetical protein [Novosphingobium sp. NBM11]MBF5091290.1 hypothetical protein [Novosphingobium sp. NBM11]